MCLSLFVKMLIICSISRSQADLRYLTGSCWCCCFYRRRLKYRHPAVRRRFGDSNIHDVSMSSPHDFRWRFGDSILREFSHSAYDRYSHLTFSRAEFKFKTTTVPSRKRDWSNCRPNSAPSFDVSGLNNLQTAHEASNGDSTGVFVLTEKDHV